MNVASLHIYPVKSCRGIRLERTFLEWRGLTRDRRWMITDADNHFLTQRNCGALARIGAQVTDAGLVLSVDGSNSIEIGFPSSHQREAVTVWHDTVEALRASEIAENWISQAIGRDARLFYMDDEAERKTSAKWSERTPVSFADGYPVLVTSMSSLAALNEDIRESGNGEPIAMERFRPNIVIDGADPWAEDHWSRLQIGEVTIDLVKPCSRCIITTRDPQTGEVTGRDPLKTLGQIRRSAHPDSPGVLFGWNAIVRNQGAVHVGDTVNVESTREDGWPLG
ncbi:MOSC domain-containing protein [Hyphococcus sp. DH-69]|uniref:MOSC domain-containing protein n=1 Tax=Hyphococcus formosus TaxID=3143534 RepID=UPI00398B855F